MVTGEDLWVVCTHFMFLCAIGRLTTSHEDGMCRRTASKKKCDDGMLEVAAVRLTIEHKYTSLDIPPELPVVPSDTGQQLETTHK